MAPNVRKNPVKNGGISMRSSGVKMVQPTVAKKPVQPAIPYPVTPRGK